MSSEVLLSNIIPFAGSGLVGYTIGFALKKILKWILIIIGFLAVGVQLLQKYGYVGTVYLQPGIFTRTDYLTYSDAV
jgi:uncharacterized membrane protein (Fun14 family)